MCVRSVEEERKVGRQLTTQTTVTKVDGHWEEGVCSAERQWDVQSRYGKFRPWGSITAAAVQTYGHQQGSDENSDYSIDNTLESEYTVFLIGNCAF